MCGSLKHSEWSKKSLIKFGETFPSDAKIKVRGEFLNKETKWNGFAQEEKLTQWIKNGWMEGYLDVDSFTEQGVKFYIPEDWAIKIIILKKDKNYLNIVTRQATQEEMEIHHRFPLTVKKL
jgi:hypothetical protein